MSQDYVICFITKEIIVWIKEQKMSRREEKRPVFYCVRIKNIRINIVIHFNIFTFHGTWTWGLSRNVCDIILWIIKPRDGLCTVELQGSSLDTFPSDWEVRIVQSSISMAIITWISNICIVIPYISKSCVKLAVWSIKVNRFNNVFLTLPSNEDDSRFRIEIPGKL